MMKREEWEFLLEEWCIGHPEFDLLGTEFYPTDVPYINEQLFAHMRGYT